ncbi:inhibitor of nuclear factor kappa-B kinase subunit alpha-like [Tachypleus tridentatus]|uniref:inhibitor of nuclear factor kappa-B kinase subunit alpha-like n=1 Tax=Tachypleus tridentatus TaxID=6853 RepID=UPI003FD14EFE
MLSLLEVPSALDTSSSNLPLLAMEYCAGGDLRKKFGKPENCCGLPEKNVRIFLHQIASAVEYLHKRRIIHRDLKPENILLQENDGKLQYKLIDLGYAKELDQGSICTSFVGTLQYLAPELFHSKRYSYTVDYWSLGLVTHEIIVGYRPFLPSLSPAQWIPFAEKKSSSTITMYLDNEGKIHCSEEMSPYNNISRVFQKYLEDWLQIMLEWDPHTRGHRNGRKAFDILKDILDKKVIEVFVVKTCKTLSYEVDDTTKLFHLQQWIEEDTQIPVSEQELLLPQGVALDPDKSICQYWSNQEGEELLLYMFDRRPQFADEEVNFNYHPMVETMMRNPKTPVSYEDQKRVGIMLSIFVNKKNYVVEG